MLYFVAGVLYKRYVLQERGFAQIPRFSLFSFTDTLDFFQNICDRSLGTLSHPFRNDSDSWHSRGRSDRRGYGRLPTLPEEEEGLVRDDGESDHRPHGADHPIEGGDET